MDPKGDPWRAVFRQCRSRGPSKEPNMSEEVPRHQNIIKKGPLATKISVKSVRRTPKNKKNRIYQTDQIPKKNPAPPYQPDPARSIKTITSACALPCGLGMLSVPRNVFSHFLFFKFCWDTYKVLQIADVADHIHRRMLGLYETSGAWRENQNREAYEIIDSQSSIIHNQ